MGGSSFLKITVSFPLLPLLKSAEVAIIIKTLGKGNELMDKRNFTSEQLHYLRLLSKQYPTVQAAGTEVIRLQAILNLPKGTEHFMSDIHGEHEAFLHILNSGSGEVKEKLEELFGNTMTQRDRNDLATLASKRMLMSAGVTFTKLKTNLDAITLSIIPEEDRK